MSVAEPTNFLVQNGAGFNMLKSGTKRRRTTKEVQFEREQSKMKTADFQQKMSQLKAFETQLQSKQKSLEHGEEACGILSGLIKSGQVKQHKDGTWSSIAPQASPEK